MSRTTPGGHVCIYETDPSHVLSGLVFTLVFVRGPAQFYQTSTVLYVFVCARERKFDFILQSLTEWKKLDCFLSEQK